MKEVKPPKKPLLYYYGIILVVILILNSFIFPAIFQKQVKEVDYGTFLTMVEEGNVEKVEIKENYILFNSDSAREKDSYFRTGAVDDPKLVDRLHEADVEFTKVIPRENSPFLSFLLMWILPLIIFIVIGQWFAKKMQGKMMGGGNALSFGKSKAKVYVEAQIGITFADVAGQDEAKEALTGDC